MKMLRDRFEAAREEAAKCAENARKADLAKRIKAFQLRDIRPQAASEITSLEDAGSLLGHTDKGITKRVYRRAGKVVKPTKSLKLRQSFPQLLNPSKFSGKSGR